MNVYIKVIPHGQQRYETVGDWYFEGSNEDTKTLQIRVSKMGNWKYEMLVAVHELAEVLQCRYLRISTARVDKFDIAFEKKRKPGNTDEPGDDGKAPYRVQHGIATGFERILAALLGVDWNKYESKINSL